jgi:hypothetical protein
MVIAAGLEPFTSEVPEVVLNDVREQLAAHAFLANPPRLAGVMAPTSTSCGGSSGTGGMSTTGALSSGTSTDSRTTWHPNRQSQFKAERGISPGCVQ